MQKIIHIVNRDKFTVGYIEFMYLTFTQYNHVFFTVDKDEDRLDVLKDCCVNYYKSSRELFIPSSKYFSELKSATKIIITGVFDNTIFGYLTLSHKLLKKTYFHFWGGDFYRIRNEVRTGIKPEIIKVLREKCFSDCAGLIFLIEGEYDQFKKITGVENRNFIAPMLDSPNKTIDYTQYKPEYNDGKLRIILGNSATKTNRHIEALELLNEHLTGNFLVICPLSYGDKDYGDAVEKKGLELFGESFIPLRQFMKREEYIQLLANCDIGFFNNDRQQGMGNINILLRLGKTVYIRRNTTMWDQYNKRGNFLKSIEEIEKEGIKLISEQESRSNQDPLKLIEQREKGIHQWQQVLED